MPTSASTAAENLMDIDIPFKSARQDRARVRDGKHCRPRQMLTLPWALVKSAGALIDRRALPGRGGGLGFGLCRRLVKVAGSARLGTRLEGFLDGCRRARR